MSTSTIEPVERVATALLEPLYEEQARRRGQRFSVRSGVPGIITLGEVIMPDVGGATMNQLAEAHRNPSHPFNELVEVECSQRCGTKLRCFRLTASLTACDPCIAKAKKADALEKAKAYWEDMCPPAFRETDKTHAGFPSAIYASLKDYTGGESLLLFGPSGRCKSRVGMLLIKRCLVRFNQHVGVLWPEQLKAVKKSFDALELIQKWGRYDLLLMDDALLTGAQDERVTDFLKDLLDYRMRYKRHQIITSQIGGTEYEAQANKFENITDADRKRVVALLRRVRETCRVVSFAEAAPTQGEQAF